MMQSHVPTRHVTTILLLAAAALTPSAAAQHVDSLGREWLQPKSFTGRTWEQIRALCPDDGTTPCSGVLNGVDITGYVWATKGQMQLLFADFVPAMATTESISGSAYVLPGLAFTGTFLPTYEFYTTFGAYLYVGGWTATEKDGSASIADASAQYPVFNGSFSVAGTASTTTTSAFRGAWFFRPPVVPCDADLDGNGTVDGADLAALLGAWGATEPGAADLDGSGLVDGTDLAVLLGAWGGC